MQPTPGAALREWRLSQENLSQAALGEMLGLRQYTISRIEDGTFEPRASLAEKIRQVTGGAVTWARPTGTEALDVSERIRDGGR